MTMPRIPRIDVHRGLLPDDAEAERKRRMGAGGGLLAPFLPGDKALLAEQLASGFGGAPDAYMAQLSRMYQPMRMGFNFGAGMGGMGMGGGTTTPEQPPSGGMNPNFRLSPVGWSPK